jgi:hypothetical protein
MGKYVHTKMSFEEKHLSKKRVICCTKNCHLQTYFLERKGHDYERFLKDAYIKTQYSKIIESNQFSKCPHKIISISK